MKKLPPQPLAGFSLVEMLVAVSVLLIVIVGPMTVTSRAAKSSSFATEQAVAFFLAQEGLEITQKVRDDLLLQYFAGTIANPWATFTNTGGGGTYRDCYAVINANGCGLDWSRINVRLLSSVVSCATLSDCLLKYRAASDRSKYTYSTNGTVVDTPFTRRIVLTIVGGNSVEVKSIVTWRTGSIAAEQRVETSTYLYNIYATP
jgi:prepilin-type N-terminal cleavage/methylation domain-containing protein